MRAVGFAVPEDFQFLALGVVVGAGERDAGGMAKFPGCDDPLHEPGPLPNLDELADLRRNERQADVGIGYGHREGVRIVTVKAAPSTGRTCLTGRVGQVRIRPITQCRAS